MKKKEVTKVTESVEKAVKRFLKHIKFYEYADDMVIGVYSAPNGLLVRMKKSQASLMNMSGDPLSELELSGYNLLGITGKTKNHVVLKEHDVENGKKLSVTFYDISHPGNKEVEDTNKEVPLYADMQKELIEDVEDDTESVYNTTHRGIVLTESDLDQEIEAYLDTFFKGTTKKISDMDLSELPGLLLGGTMDTIAKLIMQDYEDHGILYDKSTIKDLAKFGLYEILVAMAYRSSTLKNQVIQTTKEMADNFKMFTEATETMKKQQDEIFALKRENAKLKDQLGDMRSKLDSENTIAQETLNNINNVTAQVTSKEFLRMNSFRAYITTVIGKPGSIITLSDLMRFVQSVLKEENGKYPFISSLEKQGVSPREYKLLRDDKIKDSTFTVNQLKALLTLYADGNSETILQMQNILWKAPFRLYKYATEEVTHEVLNELRADIIKDQSASQDSATQDANQGTEKNEDQVLSEA